MKGGLNDILTALGERGTAPFYWIRDIWNECWARLKRPSDEGFLVTLPDPRPALFQQGPFALSSGVQSDWKIECDSFTDEDWETLAHKIGTIYHFGAVVGVPTGGLKLATALQKYIRWKYPVLLVVDDVLTTGASILKTMTEVGSGSKRGYFTFGVVVFARGPCPQDVYPIFQLMEKCNEASKDLRTAG